MTLFLVTINLSANFKYLQIFISLVYHQIFHDLLGEAVAKRDIQDIIMYLKVLGNAGLPSSVKPITKILPIVHSTTASSLPMRVHTEAILALRNIAKKEPKMVNFTNKTIHQKRLSSKMILLFSLY